MRNAKRFDDRITVGGVPTSEDLAQLKELGYRTIVDLRDEEEKFGGFVEKRSQAVGLRYVSIPIRREAILSSDVVRFCEVVFERNSAPVYAFSRFGKRPLALLLLFEAVARGTALPAIFKKASSFGLNLEGDLTLQTFLVDFYNAGKATPIVASVRAARPDLFEG